MSGVSRPYHFGELRSALIEAGLKLSRSGGIKAMGLREVTRAVGVSPNAAYRHFTDQRALVVAVADQVQDLLAAAMFSRMQTASARADPKDRALARLRAVGLGYIDFAISEPGWFELSLLSQDDTSSRPPSVTREGRVPPSYQMLLDALNHLLEIGVLTLDQRASAEWSCWSTVHGFADLATRGPLRSQPRTTINSLAAQVVDTVIMGIRA